MSEIKKDRPSDMPSPGEEMPLGEKASKEKISEEKTLEEAFRELDLLAARLEDRNTSLEDSFILYRQGMDLLKYCNERLDKVEKKMLEISEDGTYHAFSG